MDTHNRLDHRNNLCGTIYQRKRDLKQHKKADHKKKKNSSSTSTGSDGKVVTAARPRSRAERNRDLFVRTANDERERELQNFFIAGGTGFGLKFQTRQI